MLSGFSQQFQHPIPNSVHASCAMMCIHEDLLLIDIQICELCATVCFPAHYHCVFMTFYKMRLWPDVTPLMSSLYLCRISSSVAPLDTLQGAWQVLAGIGLTERWLQRELRALSGEYMHVAGQSKGFE
jgi:hypothetical protein